MKNFFTTFLFFAIMFIAAPPLFAQTKDGKSNEKNSKSSEKKKHPQVKYRRSSLYMIMIEDEKLPNANVIKDVFSKSPIPDKFNDHSLGSHSFVSAKYALTANEKTAAGAKTESKTKSMFKDMAKQSVTSATGGLVDTTDTKYLPQIIGKYLAANNVARDMVAKWFNRDANGAFNMNLIAERGSYDASALQINIAKSSARGMASIKDAGVELIGNTFVIVTRFNYISKKVIYDEAQALLKATGLVPKTKIKMTPQMQALKDAAIKKLTEGYVVQSTSYLYQLVWSDSIEAVFYNDMWMDGSNIDQRKKDAFDNSNLFALKYIGSGKATADVPLSLKKRSDDELIALATRNSSYAVIVKLQREYEVFKTKTPLFNGNPITAKIGLKEGLKKGDKFEVLEQSLDNKTGMTVYKRKGIITPNQNMIWDDRYNAGEEIDEEIDAANSGKPDQSKPKLEFTTFKGGSKYYDGMLIRQIN